MDPRTIIEKELNIYIYIYMALCAAVLPINLYGSYQLLKSQWDRKIYLVNEFIFVGLLYKIRVIHFKKLYIANKQKKQWK